MKHPDRLDTGRRRRRIDPKSAQLRPITIEHAAGGEKEALKSRDAPVRAKKETADAMGSDGAAVPHRLRVKGYTAAG